MGMMVWTLEQWVQEVATDAEGRERWREQNPRRVDEIKVYGYEQYREGWHALWERTEAVCSCGCVELVPWRPGHRNAAHDRAVGRVQAVECWECGEVLDLRLERRDRNLEDGRDAEKHRSRTQWQTSWGKDRRGRYISKPRRASVVGSRGVARQRARDAAVAGKSEEPAVVGVVDKAARRAEAVKRARAHHGGERFVIGALAAWLSGSRG